jgi:tetratricopeptide (TPR) repeat protein
VAGLVVLIMIGLGVARWRRRRPAAAFAIGWYLLTLLPVLDLVPLAPRALNMADRYAFIPSLGPCWLLAEMGAAGLDRLWPTRRGWAIRGAALAGGLLLAWVGSTLAYTPVWRNNVSLFTRVIRDHPLAAYGHQGLGLALLRAGRPPEAIAALEAAQRLAPNDAMVQLTLARAYVEHGRPQEGLRLLEEAEPRLGDQTAALLTRARLHLLRDEWDAAEGVLLRLLRRFPDHADAHAGLGYVRERRGDLRAAREAYGRAVALRPDLAWALLGLSRTLLELGAVAEAEQAAQAVLALRPGDPAASTLRRLAAAGQRDVSPPRPVRPPSIEETAQ